MKYMGSKNRIAKHILPIILKYRKPNQFYVEPFVGGGNMIDKVSGNRMGIDINPYVIQALKLIRDNIDLIPRNNSEFTEEDYISIKGDKNNLLHGYVSFALSYAGKFWGGWRRDKEGKRDYVAEAYKNAIKQSKKIKFVKLYNTRYNNFDYPKNSIIYCDPPYFGTTKYKDKFNHENFWNWCRKMKKDGHTIFISEYSAPDDFKCIWEKEIVSSLTKNTGNKVGIEKLFTI